MNYPSTYRLYPYRSMQLHDGQVERGGCSSAPPRRAACCGQPRRSPRAAPARQPRQRAASAPSAAAAAAARSALGGGSTPRRDGAASPPIWLKRALIRPARAHLARLHRRLDALGHGGAASARSAKVSPRIGVGDAAASLGVPQRLARQPTPPHARGARGGGRRSPQRRRQSGSAGRAPAS